MLLVRDVVQLILSPLRMSEIAVLIFIQCRQDKKGSGRGESLTIHMVSVCQNQELYLLYLGVITLVCNHFSFILVCFIIQ